MNGDRKTDVATADWGYQNSVSVLLGNGDGTLRPRYQVLEGGLYFALVTADLNGDGNQDLVVEDDRAMAISILLGGGDGTFGPKRDVAAGGLPYVPALGDLNEDGKLDLVVPVIKYTPNRRNIISVFLGNGDGTFGAGTDFITGWNPSFVAVGDLDNDGHADIATANAEAHTISVLLGFGDGALGTHADFGVAGRPFSLAIGDFDGDGREDLVAGNTRGNSITVLLNRSAVPGISAARAFLRSGERSVPVLGGPGRLCVLVEPMNAGFDVADVDPSSVSMLSSGTGSVGQIAAIPQKTIIDGDVDRNGIAEYPAYFAREDLGRLLGEIRGRHEVTVSIRGRLRTGGRVGAELVLTVVGTGRPLTARVSPNPFNPSGRLRFDTQHAGRLCVRVFDLQGRLVRVLLEMPLAPRGEHEIKIDARDDRGRELPSGIYFYHIEAPDGVTTGRFAIMK